MNGSVSPFLDFNLPNATTWFYFSFLLATALFFKFSRILSIRNWDVVTIFILAPGLLLLQQSWRQPVEKQEVSPEDVSRLILAGGGRAITAPAAGAAGAVDMASAAQIPASPKDSSLWIGYLWLLTGSAYLLFRCLFDLVLIRRPALGPNLSFGGQAWFAGALFICLAAVAFRPPLDSPVAVSGVPEVSVNGKAGDDTVGRPTAPLQLARESLGWSYFLMRSFAMLCHLSIVVGLVYVGARHFQSAPAGMSAATFYLLLPYTGYFVGQLHHVWPMALMIWALATYRKPMLAGLFLGVAAGTAFFPVLLLPIWLSFYWRRGAGRFVAAFLFSAGLCLAITGLVLWINNDLERIIDYTLAMPDWQPWKLKSPTQESVWVGLHWAYRLPVSIVYLAFVIITAIWPNPKNLAHVIALSTAILIGIQFWYADQGGVYILWYLPLFLLMIFRPNLAEYRPLPINPETDWLTHFFRAAGRGLKHQIKPHDTLVRMR